MVRNRNLHLPLQRYGIEPSEWFLRVICGSIQIRTVYIGCKIAKVAVISRLSCNRVGTRFNVRGINDDGHVANFIETEQVYFIFSFISKELMLWNSSIIFLHNPQQGREIFKEKFIFLHVLFYLFFPLFFPFFLLSLF